MKQYEIEVDLIGFSPYNFENPDTKQVISGLKLSIVQPGNSNEEGGGSSVCQLNRPYDELAKFKALKYPCKAIVNFSVPNIVGKPVINEIKPINR